MHIKILFNNKAREYTVKDSKLRLNEIAKVVPKEAINITLVNKTL
jgi:hypothetical protein